MTDQERSDWNLERQRAREADREITRLMTESHESFIPQVARETERMRWQHSSVAKSQNAS